MEGMTVGEWIVKAEIKSVERKDKGDTVDLLCGDIVCLGEGGDEFTRIAYCQSKEHIGKVPAKEMLVNMHAMATAPKMIGFIETIVEILESKQFQDPKWGEVNWPFLRQEGLEILDRASGRTNS